MGENNMDPPPKKRNIELLLSILRHTLSSLNVWEGRRRLSHKNSEKKGVSLKLPYLWKRTSCITLCVPKMKIHIGT